MSLLSLRGKRGALLMRMPNKNDDLLLQTLRIGMNSSVKNRMEHQLYAQQMKKQDAESFFRWRYLTVWL